MKKIIATMFILGALMTGTVIYANGTSNQPGGIPGKTARITFSSVSDGATLTIKDSNDRTIYEEQVKQEGAYAKNFDFSNLPDAAYYFEMDTKDSIRIYPFVVSGKQVKMLDGERYSIAKPELHVEGDKLFLTKGVSDQQPVKVDFYYEGRELAYSEQLIVGGELNRIYDFSTSKRGDYFVVIQSGDRTFRESIRINGTYW